MNMLALIKAPGAPAQRYDLPEAARPQLDAMQTVVGGYIETAVRGRDFTIWCNEEGKLLGLPLNFCRPTDGEGIVGTVLITGSLVGSMDGYVPSALDDGAVERIARLLTSWAEAGEFCDTEPEHFDPRSEREREEAERAASEELERDRVRKAIAKSRKGAKG
jgi:hypothetical protein